MPDPVTSSWLVSTAFAVWGYIKWPVDQLIKAFQLNKKVASLEDTVKELQKRPADPSPHRKCPVCSERDLRLQDRYRYRSDPFDHQRYFHEKWRCFNCGHIEETNLPEPGG